MGPRKYTWREQARSYSRSRRFLADAANFLVAISASVQGVTVISKHRYGGWSHGYNRSMSTNVNTATELQKVSEGTLILEFSDTASEGVVWQSQAAGVITRRDDMGKAVDAAGCPHAGDIPSAFLNASQQRSVSFFGCAAQFALE